MKVLNRTALAEVWTRRGAGALALMLLALLAWGAHATAPAEHTWPWLQGSGELSASLLLGLGLVALPLVMPGMAPVWLRAAGLPVLGIVALAVAQSLWGQEGDPLAQVATQLGTDPPSGVSMVGLHSLGVWMVSAGLILWGLAGQHALHAAVSLALAAGQCVAVALAWAFTLTCRWVLGEWPGGEVLMSLPMLLIVSLLTLGLTAAARLSSRAHPLFPDAPPYRRAFTHSMALLATISILGGLAGAGLVAASLSDSLLDSLLVQVDRQARALERQVTDTADAVVRAAHLRGLGAETRHPGEGERELAALMADLQPLGQVVVHSARQPARLGATLDPAVVLPVLSRATYRAGLLPNRSVQVVLPGADAGADLVVQVRLEGAAMQALELTLNPLNARQVLCQEAGTAMRCRDSARTLIAAADKPASWHALALKPRVAGDHGPMQRARTEPGRTALHALSPVGALGTHVALQVDAAVLIRSLGAPLLLAVMALTAISLAGAAWSFWRQLPVLRRMASDRARAEAMSAHMPLATLMLDPQQRIISANPAALYLLHVTDEALLGAPITRLLPDWPEHRTARGPETAFDTQGAGMHQALTQDGRSLPVDVRVAHFRKESGWCTVLMLRDLRAQKAADADIQRWRQVFQESGSGMAIISTGACPQFELVNPAFARLFGHEPGELLGKAMAPFVAESHRRVLLAIRDQATREGNVRAQMRHRHRNGREFSTLCDVSAVKGASGELSCFVVSVQDISELKAAQEQLGQMAARLRAVLEALPVGLWIGSSEGQVQQTNPAARRLWVETVGKPPDAEGQQARQLPFAPAEAYHESLLRRAAVANMTVDGGVQEHLGADGSMHAVSTTANPIHDAAGQVIGAVAVDEDLSAVRRGELAARQALALLERVLDASAIGMAVCESDGALVRTNLAWQALLGASLQEGEPAAPCRLIEVLDLQDASGRRDLIRRVCLDDEPTYFGEHRLRRADGKLAWTLVVISRLPGLTSGSRQALVQLLDIDARRRAGEELTASQARLAAAQRMAGIGDWTWHVERKTFECSDQMLRITGIDPRERDKLIGARLMQIVHPDDRERVRAAALSAVADGRTLAEDCRMVPESGRPTEVHVQALVKHTPDGPLLVGTVQDVTERKRIERDLLHSRERLRELVTHEGAAVEAERKRIAREVHDELGQLLTGLRMDLAMLRSQVEPGSAAAMRAEAMRETMSTMTEVVRHVAANLRPYALDLGLPASIEWLAEDFSHRWEVRCEVQVPADDELHLPEAVALALFRAVQESLTNVARHAQAQQVSIRLTHEPRRLRLVVQDDGCGFDPDLVAARGVGGLGLLGMRERMLAIGAQITLDSRPSRGTRIEIVCPLTP